MRKLVIILLCAVLVNARWSLYHTAKDHEDGHDDHDHDHDHDSLDWWEHSVFYQIYPRSFKDSDGDGNGDIRGIIDNLHHLHDLGVTGAWLSPIFQSPMVDGGYDIQDFKEVNPLFGNNQDLRDLFDEAKKLGLKIILDFVPNHTSDQHEWFLASANRTEGYEDYYIWRECELDPNGDGVERILPNNWIAVFHTKAWTYHAGRNQCYLHQFTPQQPDLNYRNNKVRQEMMDILRYWLEQGADGFRIDAINHMFEVEGLPDEVYIDENGDKNAYDNLIHNHTMDQPESYEFIYDVRTMMNEFVAASEDKITRFMMTEAYATIEDQVRWYGSSESRRGAHMPFNFALISELDVNSTAVDFKDAIDLWLNAMPDYARANWVLGNHDRPRVGYRYGEDRHESLAIMTMMLPGLNVVYYGEEILMVDNRNISFAESDDPQACQTNDTVYMLYTRDPVRTPFQWDDTDWAGFSNTNNKTWLPVHENYKEVNLKAQKEAPKSTFKLYQEMIRLRKDKHVLHVGKYEGKVLTSSLFGFTRSLADHDTIAVFINLGGETTVNLNDLIKEEDFPENTKVRVLLVNNNSTLDVGSLIQDYESIQLGQYDAVVLEVSSATKLVISMLLITCSLIKMIF